MEVKIVGMAITVLYQACAYPPIGQFCGFVRYSVQLALCKILCNPLFIAYSTKLMQILYPKRPRLQKLSDEASDTSFPCMMQLSARLG